MKIVTPTEEALRNIDVKDILPHRNPFLLVDNIIYIDDTITKTEFSISENCIFVSNGVFNAEALIEIVAQTCAARIGYISKYLLNKEVSIGYIGAIRSLVQYTTPKVGDKLICSIEILDQVFNMSRAIATIYSNDNVVLTTEIKVVEISKD
ncbi:MAG: pseudouridylate synthase [Bacteroidia bacterium]|nr:pseudouridylate synthase [Bacteroidia bacterium]